MPMSVFKYSKRFLEDQNGVTLVEYGIAISLALLVGVTALTTLGGEISTALTVAGTEMPN